MSSELLSTFHCFIGMYGTPQHLSTIVIYHTFTEWDRITVEGPLSRLYRSRMLMLVKKFKKMMTTCCHSFLGKNSEIKTKPSKNKSSMVIRGDEANKFYFDVKQN